MKLFISIIASVSMLSTVGVCQAADWSSQYKQEARDRDGVPTVPMGLEAQEAHILSKLSGEGFSPEHQALSQQLKRQYGPIVFVGASPLQSSVIGCADFTRGYAKDNDDLRMALANAAVCVDPSPTYVYYAPGQYDENFKPEVLGKFVGKLSEEGRLIPAHLKDVNAEVGPFKTFVLDRSVFHNIDMPQLAGGIHRLTAPGSLVVLPVPSHEMFKENRVALASLLGEEYGLVISAPMGDFSINPSAYSDLVKCIVGSVNTCTGEVNIYVRKPMSSE
jgi:hypothetical protein